MADESGGKVVALYPAAPKGSIDHARALRNAASLLAENFALDYTLRDLLLEITEGPPDSQASFFIDSTSEARSSGPAGLKSESKKAIAAAKAARHQSAIALFCRLWTEIRTGTYTVFGARDGAAVKRLLGFPDATDAEIERRMRLALADPFFQRAGNLAFFVSRWSTYDRAAAPPVRQQAVAQGSSRRIVGINADGSMKYAE
jgi:hypothetical protein